MEAKGGAAPETVCDGLRVCCGLAAEGDGPRVEADTPVGGTNGLMSLLALADDDVVEEEEDVEGVEEEDEEELFCMLLVIIAVTDDVCTFDTSSTSSEHGQTHTRPTAHAHAPPHTRKLVCTYLSS